MKKFYIIIFFIVAMHGSRALTDSILSPEELLIEAKKGRVEYVRAMADVTANVRFLSNKPLAFRYMSVLSDLNTIETGYNLDTMGISPVNTLGQALTLAAAKWMRVDTDPVDELELFLRYANDNTRYTLADMQSRLIDRAQTPSELFTWMERGWFCAKLSITLKAEPFVIQGFEDLEATAVRRALKDSLIGDYDFSSKVMERAKSMASLREISDFLGERAILAVDVPTAINVIRLCETFDRNVQANKLASLSLQGAPAQLIATTLQRIFDLHGDIAKEDLKSAVDILDARGLTSISGFLTSLSDELIHKDQVKLVTELAIILAKKCEEMGITQQKIALEKLIAKLAVAREFSNFAFEGSYPVHFTNGKNGIITLVNAGSSYIVAGITMWYGDFDNPHIPVIEVNFTNFYFSFNETTQMFESIGNPNDTVEFQMRGDINTDLYFRLKPGNCIAGSFGYPSGETGFYGCRTEKFPTFDKPEGSLDISTYTSSWKGTCAGHTTYFRMSQVGRRVQGNLVDSPSLGEVPFNFGVTDLLAKSAVLTSGEMENGRMGQARVRFLSEGRLEMVYIVGGRGIRCHSVFERVYRPGFDDAPK